MPCLDNKLLTSISTRLESLGDKIYLSRQTKKDNVPINFHSDKLFEYFAADINS